MKQRVAYLWAVVFVAAALCPSVSSAFTTDSLEELGLSFTGYFEPLVEFISAEEGDSSNIKISSLEFGVDYTPDDWALVHVLLHYDQDLGHVEGRQAYVSLGGSEAMPVIFTIGKFYQPMGGYSSLFCGDPLCAAPLTKRLTETLDEVVQVAYDFGLVEVKAGVGNGSTDEIGDDDTIDLYYGHIEVVPMTGVIVGASYTSDLADAIAIADLVPEEGTTDQVPGYSVYVIYETGPFYGRLGYAAATKSFAAVDLDLNADGIGDEPSAWAITLAYDVMENVQVGALYSSADDLDVDEQYGLAVNYTVFEGIVLSLEYVHGLPCCGDEADNYVGRLKFSF